MPSCYCLVPDASGTRVLLVNGPEGWTLPTVEHADDWFARGSGRCGPPAQRTPGHPAGGTARGRGGGPTPLRARKHQPGVVAGEWLAVGRSGGRRGLATQAARPAGRSCSPGSGSPAAGGRPRRGPLGRRRAGTTGRSPGLKSNWPASPIPPTGPVEQVKTAWSCSCILRVPTTAGYLYFKATYARPPAEVAVVQELARRWPSHVPTLVAADVSRRWMLMEDFGPRELSRMPFARWPGALRLFGRLQRECSASLSVWLGIGCPDRRMDNLVRRLEPLLSDPLLAKADPPFRLGEGDLRTAPGGSRTVGAGTSRVGRIAAPGFDRAAGFPRRQHRGPGAGLSLL